VSRASGETVGEIVRRGFVPLAEIPFERDITPAIPSAATSKPAIAIQPIQPE
jgi:hypothetical protein